MTLSMDNLAHRIAKLPAEKRALLELRLKQNASGNGSPQQVIPRRKTGGPAPLSFAQQRLWFIDQLEPGSAVYNVPAAYRLKGPLDIKSLEQSLNEIVRRHESLRTTFRILDGSPLQIVASELTLPLPILDLSDCPENEREAEAHRLADEEAQRPFNLVRGPLIRVKLLRLERNDHILLLAMHHIVSDGWSGGVLYRELSTLYGAFSQDKPSPLSELPIQYADYAVWQREWLQGEALERQLSYWKKQLENISTLQLPTDRARPTIQSYRGSRQTLRIDNMLSEALKALSRREGATLFMTLLAAFQVLLRCYTRQDDIAVGSPIAGRNRVEIEPLIGFFVNTLVFRSDLSGNPSFRELLCQVREAALGAYAHQDLPFERLVEELQPERSLSHSPLFQVVFALQNTPRRSLSFEGLSVSRLQLKGETAKFDLTLTIGEEVKGLSTTLGYNTDLFDEATIDRMLRHYQRLLQDIVADPNQRISDLSIMTEAEKHQLLVEWNDTRKDYPRDKCVHELFEEQVERTPEAVAVVFEGQQLTYRQLNQRSNQLAHFLRRRGVEPETLVGICLERSLGMIVAILGVLKAGGAYVPLDPTFPKERIAFMLEDIQAPVLITQNKLLGELPETIIEDCIPAIQNQKLVLPSTRAQAEGSQVEGSKTYTEARRRIQNVSVVCLDTDWNVIAQQSEDNPVTGAGADNLAYVIYTSGSTGQPKGVAVEHRQIGNYLAGILDRIDLPGNASFATVSTLSADLGNTVVFVSLCTGGSLHVMSQDRVSDAAAMADYFNHHSIDCLKIVPSHLAALQASSYPERVLPRRLLILGGEACDLDLVNGIHELVSGCTIMNHYGPTEATIGVLTYRLEKDELSSQFSTLPLGRPIANTQIYILDDHLQPVPIGVPGELHIAGAGLTRGYLNHPQLTAEKFIANPFGDKQGDRLYKTGDLARYLPDGNIEFLGRIDNQVKIRGYRVEPGEIEATLRQHASVRDAAVIAWDDTEKIASGAEASNGDRNNPKPVLPSTRAQAEGRQVEGSKTCPEPNRRIGNLKSDRRLVAYAVPHQNRSPSVAGKRRYPLPNGAAVAQLNKNETDYIYQEIFERQAYLRHGITIKDGDCIFDVGANIGLFMLFAHQICKSPKVHCFEPHPGVFEILSANASLYGPQTKLFNCGLSDEDKAATFTFFPGFSLLSGFYADPQAEKQVVKTFMINQQRAGASEMAELVEHADDILDERFVPESFSAKLRTLSSIIEQEDIESIDLLKINVEKSELDVLNGIEKKHWPKIKQIVLEVDVKENLPTITSLLERHGYEFTVEQDTLLADTPLCYVYAIRPSKDRMLVREQRNGVHLRPIPLLNEPFLSATELRSYLSAKLPEYMIPSAFVFLEALPLTPNGKLDRKALPPPGQCRSETEERYVGPRTPVEEIIAEIWSEVLKVHRVGIHDNFFDLGGHSLTATQVMSRLREALHIDLPLRALFEAPTVEQLACLLQQEESSESQSSFWSANASFVVPFQTNGSKPPLFWLNWASWDFRLPRYLGSDQPVYGLQHQGQDGQRALHTTVEEMAAHYIKEIKTIQPKGPYFLGGLCFGGMVVFEMAQQLQKAGEEVALLTLVYPTRPRFGKVSSDNTNVSKVFSQFTRLRNKVQRHLRELAPLRAQEKLNYGWVRVEGKCKGLWEKISQTARRVLLEVFGRPLPFAHRIPYVLYIYGRAARAYRPQPYRGRVILFKGQGFYRRGQSGYENLIVGGLEVQELDANHNNVLKEPYVQSFAKKLKGSLVEAQLCVSTQQKSATNSQEHPPSKVAVSAGVNDEITLREQPGFTQ